MPGIDVAGGVLAYVGISVVLGLVNAVLGPLLSLAALPLSFVTLGGSAMVVNGVLLAITALLTPQLNVDGLGSVILGALVIAIFTTVLELVVRPSSIRAGVTRDYWRAIATRMRSSGLMKWSLSSSPRSIWTHAILPVKWLLAGV